jgi:hypothetical protein
MPHVRLSRPEAAVRNPPSAQRARCHCVGRQSLPSVCALTCAANCSSLISLPILSLCVHIATAGGGCRDRPRRASNGARWRSSRLSRNRAGLADAAAVACNGRRAGLGFLATRRVLAYWRAEPLRARAAFGPLLDWNQLNLFSAALNLNHQPLNTRRRAHCNGQMTAITVQI